MIVIGVDTHKRSHTLVALDAVTGAMRGQLTIAATNEGTFDALRFAAKLDNERVWAVEDCRHVSGRLERGLVASGDRVIRVAPGLTQPSTLAFREPGKSDPIDAHLAVLTALRCDAERLPTPRADGDREALQNLLSARHDLTTAHTAQTNRLRALLLGGDDADRQLARAARPDTGLAAPARRRAAAARGLPVR